MPNSVVRVNRMIKMDLTDAEVKLILRLRQVKKSTDQSTFLVNTNPFGIYMLGQFEKMEAVITSGSYVEQMR